MLIITNGDSAVEAIRSAGITGTILPWRDVLHDGPLPSGLRLEALSDVRAVFLASCGWGTEASIRHAFHERDTTLAQFTEHEEVVLWFEHDLYDQLQLLQLLHWFANQDRSKTRLTLAGEEAFIGYSTPERLAEVFASRAKITEIQLRLGATAWEAVCDSTPDALLAFLETDTSALPFLRAALIRLCEEYPAQENGLSRNEHQILEAIEAGATRPGPLFQAVQAKEEALYLGDASFWRYLEGLMQSHLPLVKLNNGASFRHPEPPFPDQAFNKQELTLTEAGHKALTHDLDWIAETGIDKWMGGVHLHDGHIWRWHTEHQQLLRTDS